MNVRSFWSFSATTLLITIGTFFQSAPCSADAWDRLNEKQLKQTRAAVRLLNQDRQPVELKSEYTDYRALLHVHSFLSHDSNGSVEEIVAAARKVGVKVILFTDHPSPEYDFMKDGHSGLNNGVLLIPGAEKGGLLNYPLASIPTEELNEPQPRVDAIAATGGQVFLSHLEERMDWNLNKLTGTEIYNTHADAKDEKRLFQELRNPFSLLKLAPLFKKYPQECFGALLDYPRDYLKRWDELCQEYPHTGVSANDSHHNQGMKAYLADENTIHIDDALGKSLIKLDLVEKPLLRGLAAGKKPGDVIFELDLDAYDVSFHHVSTHLMLKELTAKSVREALVAGRAYVAFDWLADPTGFLFLANDGETAHPVGSQIVLTDGLVLKAAAPLPGRFRLIRDGKEVHSTTGRNMEFEVTEPGIYRVEVWQNIVDRPQIWILSNPIYVGPAVN